MTKKRFTKLLMSYGFNTKLISLAVRVVQLCEGKLSYLDAYNEIIESMLNSIMDAITLVDNYSSHLKYINDERISELDFTPLNVNVNQIDMDEFNRKLHAACGLPMNFLIDTKSTYVNIKPADDSQIIITNENTNNLDLDLTKNYYNRKYVDTCGSIHIS